LFSTSINSNIKYLFDNLLKIHLKKKFIQYLKKSNEKMGLEKFIAKTIGRKIINDTAIQLLDTNNDGKLDLKGESFIVQHSFKVNHNKS
jgi:hypothetical protein